MKGTRMSPSEARAVWEGLKKRGASSSRYTTAFQGEAGGVRRFLAIRWPEGTPTIFIEAPKSAFPRTGLSFRTRTFNAAADQFQGLPPASGGLAIDLIDAGF